MGYSDNQYVLMEKLETGVNCNSLTEPEREILWFLEKEGIAGARVDIADNLYRLTQKGEAILSIRQENVRSEQAKKQEELDRIVREKADKKADRAAEHRFQIRLSFWSAALSAVFGALVSNLDRLVPWIVNFFAGLFGRG